MKSLSVFLSLLLSYFVAAQLLPVHDTTTAVSATDNTPTTTTGSTTTTATSATSASSASKSTSSSSTSASSSRPTTTDSGPPTPSLTTISGSEVIVTFTSSASPSSSSTAAPGPSSSDSGLGTGSIVGLSVAGGVALIGVIAFFVWKFTRKQFSDFDDNEAIKWPDLNNHGAGNLDSHPLPVKNTGRSGFDTASEGDLSLSNNYSTPDFNQSMAADPYAVPPLPHLNPNQPYRDDPTSISGYYDPYRGPVPGSIENGAPTAPPAWGSEAIPMTQMGVAAGPAPGGRNSPAPQQMVYDHGRQSPGPYAAYGGSVGVSSGRMSPGPQAAYNAGSMSPAPGGRS